MAAKPQQAGTGRKPLNESEAKSQKRTLELLAEDCKRICTTNVGKPFTTLQDAIEHLLPFHVSRWVGKALSASGEAWPAPWQCPLQAGGTTLNRPTTNENEIPLIPQVLSSLSGDDVDEEEAAAAAEEGARLLCTRRDLAQELATRRAVELHVKVDEMRQRLVKLEDRYRTRHSRPLPEEELFIAQVRVGANGVGVSAWEPWWARAFRNGWPDEVVAAGVKELSRCRWIGGDRMVQGEGHR